jgi:hypothetical protein
MIFIVEGIDRVGKTTLCNKLKDAFNINVFKGDCRYNGYSNRIANTERISEVTNLLEQGFLRNIIFDRFHATEYIYGITDRSYSNFEMIDIDMRLSNIPEIIYIWVRSSDIIKSSEEHGSDLSEHECLFRDFYKRTYIPHKYNIEYSKFDAFIEMLKD